jgi:hypothetical protein
MLIDPRCGVSRKVEMAANTLEQPDILVVGLWSNWTIRSEDSIAIDILEGRNHI